jgi:Spy/CpxP family protein refolding chaperone
MKLNKTTIIAALALGSLLTFGATANAEDSTTNTPAAAPAMAAPGRRPVTIEQWAKLLALTDDQKTNFNAVLLDQRKQMMDLRTDTSLSREDKQAKRKSIADAALAKIKDILTPDQFAKYQKAVAPRRRVAPAAGATMTPTTPATPPAATGN